MRFENPHKIPTSFGCANLPVSPERGCQRVGLPISIQIREYWYYKLPMQQQSGLNWSMSHSTLAASLLSMADNCTSMKDFKRIHARTIRTGLHLNGHILGKMFRFLSVSPSGDLQYAHHMFTQMPQPNTFFYNILIRGYSKSQNPSQSICLFNQMRRNSVDPDEFTFTFLLKARSKMCSLIQMAATDEIHGHVLKFGFCSHLHVQNTLLHLYARKGIPVAAHRVFEETVDPDVVSWSGLVFAHVLAGELDEARNILEEMPDKDVVAWTTLISGYSKAKRSKDVLELFRRMQEMGIKPDEVTMICVISSCTNLGDMESGLNVHRYIDDNGFGWMISLCNALIDMYGKCGCVERARRVFDTMEKKSLISWNSMISGYANHGYMEEAIGLFQEMLDSGVSPDDVTFLAVLGACTHKGNVEEGCTLFESMKRIFDIEPRIEHYGCMVDLLGRAGRLEEAYELIINMPIPSNDVVWGALLGACRIYANVDMGERIVKRLLELKPDEGGYYILLRDIYAAAGRQMEAIEIRRAMDTAGVRKTPGCSWVGGLELRN